MCQKVRLTVRLINVFVNLFQVGISRVMAAVTVLGFDASRGLGDVCTALCLPAQRLSDEGSMAVETVPCPTALRGVGAAGRRQQEGCDDQHCRKCSRDFASAGEQGAVRLSVEPRCLLGSKVVVSRSSAASSQRNFQWRSLDFKSRETEECCQFAASAEW